MSAQNILHEPQNHTGLLGLPVEVLIAALEGVDVISMLSCQLTCRFMNNLIKGSAVLQYLSLLFACGMRDNADSPLQVGERLNRLRMHNHAWRNLQWSEKSMFSLPAPHRLENAGSLLITSRPDRRGRLSLTQLPSGLRDIHEHTWEAVHNLNATGFVFDVIQDLLVVQEPFVPRPRLHFLTLSTALPHPLARVPSIEIPSILLGHLIHSDYLFCPGISRVNTLWNWKTGTRIGTLTAHSFSIAFLSDRHMVLASLLHRAGEAVLLVYEIPVPTAEDAQSTASGEPATSLGPPVLAFGLPLFHARRMAECSVRSGTCHSHTSSPMQPSEPFATETLSTLITVSFTELTSLVRYELVVPTETLCAYLPPAHDEIETCRQVPWEDWGPQNTRVSLQPPPPPAVGWRDFCIFGMRRIGMSPQRRPDGVSVIEVCDYHPRRVARALLMDAEAEGGADQRRWEVKYGDRVDGIWAEDGEMETRLPYISTEMTLPEELQDMDEKSITMALNEDAIVACADWELSSPKQVHVWTF